MKPSKDAQDFLETILFICEREDDADCPLKGKTVFDFSAPFVAAVESFIDGFKSHLETKGFDMERLDLLQRSFGGNVFASLSGAGIGFFDEWGDEEKTLGDELQAVIEEYSGKYRFEQIDVCEDENGKLDLCILPEFIDASRAKLFNVGVLVP